LITKINIAKQDKFFKTEQEFFHSYKKKFVNELTKILLENKDKPFASDELSIATNFYDALFDFNSDCYEQQLLNLDILNKNSLKIEYVFANLTQHLITDFIKYKNNNETNSIVSLIQLCTNLQNKLSEVLVSKQEMVFDVAPTLEKKKNIRYLQDICRLKEKIKFIVHHKATTLTQEIEVVQTGKNTLIIKTNKEQIEMLKENCSTYVLLDRIDKKYFSATSKIFCERENTVLLENINELETRLLLNHRKYQRASIADSNLIYISNDNENISGHLIDISEGGIGVMSPSKSHFEKGQDILAFISYKDDNQKLNLNFESSGVLTSIIGKEHAFRYGIALELSDEKKKLIRELVKNINKNQNKLKNKKSED
jgi:c-di-GMP-binding flagellar brake protein YcgR